MSSLTIRCSAAFWVLCLTGGSLWAEIPRGRWEKVEGLNPGTAVVVKLKAGDRIEGAYRGIASEDVRLSDPTGAEIKLPKSAIQRIETAEKVRDRLANGTLMGAGAGFAAGLSSMVGFGKAVTGSGSIWSDEGKAYILSGGLVGACIGAATGALIDSRIKRPEMLYLAR
jgi:hypothetical protein